MSTLKLAADGHGNVFAAWQEWKKQDSPYRIRLDGIFIGQVKLEGITVTHRLYLPEAFPSVNNFDFLADEMGNMLVTYMGYGAGLYQSWATRYNINRGWDDTFIPIGPPDRVQETRVQETRMAADAFGNALIVWHEYYYDITTQYEESALWAIRYDFDRGWGAPVQIVQRYKPHLLGNLNIAMNWSGNAIVAWDDYNSDTGRRLIQAKRYTVDGGWGVMEFEADKPSSIYSIGMDWKGNAIMVFGGYFGGLDLSAVHFNVDSGWSTPIKLAENVRASVDSIYGSPPCYLSMDNSGNALVLYSQDTGGGISLMSKGYSVETGWDSNATLIEADVSNQRVLAFAMHGVGDATLVTRAEFWRDSGVKDQCSPKKSWPALMSDMYAFARRYKAGKGWVERTPADIIQINDITSNVYSCMQWNPATGVTIDMHGDATTVWQLIHVYQIDLFNFGSYTTYTVARFE